MKDTRLTALETDAPTVLRTGKIHIYLVAGEDRREYLTLPMVPQHADVSLFRGVSVYILSSLPSTREYMA